jgi:hypothetical protein
MYDELSAIAPENKEIRKARRGLGNGRLASLTNLGLVGINALDRRQGINHHLLPKTGDDQATALDIKLVPENVQIEFFEERDVES